MESECQVCTKHRGLSPLLRPLIYTDDLVIVTHRSLGRRQPVPGYLLIETRRHTPNLASLTDQEAAAVGRATTRAARALQQELAPESVFSTVTGRSVPHFHQRVFARPPGTPAAIPWHDVDSWSDGPRITATDLISLCARLSTHFR
ncbi:HIT family protein [Nocardia brasiliensis]|uniref:HIT family protein n=1 Tax=Nocardia brasiliensis TaxID=37326 RepID=UPI00378D2DB7